MYTEKAHKSGPDGAGNTVDSGPNPYSEGGAMEKSTSQAQEIERLRQQVGSQENVLRSLIRERRALRAVLADFAEHGTRFDLNPTTDGTPLAFVRYIARIDESVRAKAARALDGEVRP